MKNWYAPAVAFLSLTGLSLLCSGLSMGFALGAGCVTFSIASVFRPLLGAFMKPRWFILLTALVMTCKAGLASSLHAHVFITAGIPTILAGLAFNAGLKGYDECCSRDLLLRNLGNFAFKFLIPIICMAAFIAHPVTRNVPFFAAYWLIPIMIYCFEYFELISGKSTFSVFCQALCATFVAHAVGGTIWAYMIPMTAAQWMALVPIVPLERLAYAAGMSAAYLAVQSALESLLVSRFGFAPLPIPCSEKRI